MNPVISIIVPVYKVESCLRQCLDSICAQTLQEIEIILVDDGSPDNCGKICDEYAARDIRIRVIHQKNGGLSAARNAGIAVARAGILGFVDSDDWVEPDMFALLYHDLVKEEADIAVCGKFSHKNGTVTTLGDGTYHVLSGCEAIRMLYQQDGVGRVVWNKIYRRSLFDEIRFPVGRIYEDNFVMVRLVDSAKKVVFDMQPKYHYIRRDGSITASPYHSGLHDQIDAARENYDYISGKYPVLADMAWRRLVNAHFSVLFVLFSSNGKPDPEKRDACIGFLKENRRKIWAEPRIKRKKKLFLLALSIHPTLCKLLIQFSRYIQVLRNDTS